MHICIPNTGGKIHELLELLVRYSVDPMCMSVYLLKSHLTSGASIRPENTQRATEVKKVVGISLKPLHSKVMALFAYLEHPTAILQ